MTKSRASRIEAVHIEEAAALKSIYNAQSRRLMLSQAEFGAQFGLGSQGMVWQYLNAKSALNLAAAVRFAKGLGCSVSDFSPRLAREQEALSARGAFDAGAHPPQSLAEDPPTPQFSEDWTVEQMMAALAEKLIRDEHPADVEAAPSDLKRMIEKARDPNARSRSPPDRIYVKGGQQR